MQDMNSIPMTGSYQTGAQRANNNFLSLKNAIDLLEAATYRSKGYYSTLSALQAKWPSPKVGDWAVVETVINGTKTAYIWKCETAGTWTNTNVVWTGSDLTVIQTMIEEQVEGGFYY